MNVDRFGLKARKEVSTKIVLEISEDRLFCALHQFDVLSGGELDDDKFGDLKDLIEALEEVLK